ncbi:MAG TPA: hypothetical protein V6C89_17935, partial [Drouetiella sp.]
MNIFRRLTMAAVAVSAIAAMAMPANAQVSQASGSDAFSGGNYGSYGKDDNNRTGSQAAMGAGANSAQAPALQGATNGTIGPQGQDATFVTGVNTAGTVRVNNLANLEALLNIIANGMEILGIAWGGPTMIMGFMHMAAGTQDAMKRVLFGAAG